MLGRVRRMSELSLLPGVVPSFCGRRRNLWHVEVNRERLVSCMPAQWSKHENMPCPLFLHTIPEALESNERSFRG